MGVYAVTGSASPDGAVLAAGLGPSRAADHARLIAQVNYFGVVELLEAWRPALAAAGRAKVVVFSSNSTTTTPMVPAGTVRAFFAGDAEKAVNSVSTPDALRRPEPDCGAVGVHAWAALCRIGLPRRRTSPPSGRVVTWAELPSEIDLIKPIAASPP